MNLPAVLSHPSSSPSLSVVKSAMTDEDKQTVARALDMIHSVVDPIGQSRLVKDFTSVDATTKVLARLTNLLREEESRQLAAVRDQFVGKVDAHIQSVLDKRAKAITAYLSFDEETRAEMPAPKDIIAVWVSDLLPIFGKNWDLPKATKFLHDSGYVVHAKEDGRKKEQTPPYVTAQIGKPIRVQK